MSSMRVRFCCAASSLSSAARRRARFVTVAALRRMGPMAIAVAVPMAVAVPVTMAVPVAVTFARGGVHAGLGRERGAADGLQETAETQADFGGCRGLADVAPVRDD